METCPREWGKTALLAASTREDYLARLSADSPLLFLAQERSSPSPTPSLAQKSAPSGGEGPQASGEKKANGVSALRFGTRGGACACSDRRDDGAGGRGRAVR